MKNQALPRGLDMSRFFLSVLLRYGISHILYLLPSYRLLNELLKKPLVFGMGIPMLF